MAQTESATLQTLEQRRARHAWEAVQRAKRGEGSHKGQDPAEFRRQAKRLPTRIVTAGLGHAVAFLNAKNDAPGLVTELSGWINQRLPLHPKEPQELCQRIVFGDAQFLRRVTDEAVAYLQWLVRFAEAELPSD